MLPIGIHKEHNGRINTTKFLIREWVHRCFMSLINFHVAYTFMYVSSIAKEYSD